MLTEAALRLIGWKFETPKPSVKKYVGLAVPHTSNWDGLLLLLSAGSIDLHMSWMIKASWVESPVLGRVLKRTGAIGIDRSRSNNLVDNMIAEMKARDEFALFIPPEGTRGRAEHWKSGFYHIAVGAGVPVVPGYLDYGKKRAGLGPPIPMTGDVRADMDKIRAFYNERAPAPKDPKGYGPIRLREEDAPAPATPTAPAAATGK